MKRRVAQFSTEAEMCDRFIAIATGRMDEYGRLLCAPRASEWIAYPETAGWDILLVRNDGFQIGVQAKLRLNDAVIAQTAEIASSWSICGPGPDCRAVLVPHGTGSDLHRKLCATVGIQVITIRDGGQDEYPNAYFSQIAPTLPGNRSHFYSGEWPEMLPTQREALPLVVPDSVAGSPSPLTLTPWKIKAIKIACILERRGWLARQDFKHIQIDHRRFLDSRWIEPVDGAWRRGSGWPDFRRQHPRNFDEIDALWDDWKPPELPLEQSATFGRLI